MDRRTPLLLMLIFTLSAGSLGAEERYRVSLVTTGPGEEVYLWWGHTGLMVEELPSGRSSFYDFGVFSFETENFFLNFLFGRLWYMVYRSSAPRNLERMVERDRTLRQQILRFPPGEKERLVANLERQILPENRTYLYDYYFDNCATRIRDLLDEAYGGELRRVASLDERGTLRLQTRRFTGHNSLVEWGLMFLMGPSIDRPISGWEAMYLPREIPRYLKQIRFSDDRGRVLSPIAEDILLHRSSRAREVPDRPGSGLLPPAATGLLLAALLIATRRSSGLPYICGLLLYRLLLILGALIGSVLFFLAFFTDHAVAHNNWNLLLLSPLHWLAAAAPFRIKADYARPRYLLYFFPWVLTIDAALILSLTRVFDLPPQVLGQGIVLLLPLAIGIVGPWIWEVLMQAKRRSIVVPG